MTNTDRGAALGRALPEGVGRRFRTAAPPKDATGLCVAAVLVSGLAAAGSWLTLLDVRAALTALDLGGLAADIVLALLAGAAVFLALPAGRGLRATRKAKLTLSAGDLVEARVLAAAARQHSSITFGYAGAQILVLLIVEFFIANDMAVSKTFFMLPLIGSTFTLILKAFWINVYIFTIAEILILIWGLIVAVARLVPGAAGKPIRMIATFYVDTFRAIPAIITIYLIGFGIPLTGLPILKDLSQESFAILALTLTSGAYTAEVYRAGIQSIHASQTAAARSLGLSHMQTLRYVIIPQGIRHIIPPLLNGFIGLQKDTALVNVIGTIDAFNQAIIISNNHFNLSPVATVTILFIIITIPQARLVDRLIERDRRRIRVSGA